MWEVDLQGLEREVVVMALAWSVSAAVSKRMVDDNVDTYSRTGVSGKDFACRAFRQTATGMI